MKPLTPTDTIEETWGDKRFLPDRVDPQEAQVWLRPVWAKFVDNRSVLFQPKKGINLQTAINHLQTLMGTQGVQGGRRLLAAAYLCSIWFKSFEIELDRWK